MDGWRDRQTYGQMDEWMDGCYQVHLTPCFEIDNEMLSEWNQLHVYLKLYGIDKIL